MLFISLRVFSAFGLNWLEYWSAKGGFWFGPFCLRSCKKIAPVPNGTALRFLIDLSAIDLRFPFGLLLISRFSPASWMIWFWIRGSVNYVISSAFMLLSCRRPIPDKLLSCEEETFVSCLVLSPIVPSSVFWAPNLLGAIRALPCFLRFVSSVVLLWLIFSETCFFSLTLPLLCCADKLTRVVVCLCKLFDCPLEPATPLPNAGFAYFAYLSSSFFLGIKIG